MQELKFPAMLSIIHGKKAGADPHLYFRMTVTGMGLGPGGDLPWFRAEEKIGEGKPEQYALADEGTIWTRNCHQCGGCGKVLFVNNMEDIHEVRARSAAGQTQKCPDCGGTGKATRTAQDSRCRAEEAICSGSTTS